MQTRFYNEYFRRNGIYCLPMSLDNGVQLQQLPVTTTTISFPKKRGTLSVRLPIPALQVIERVYPEKKKLKIFIFFLIIQLK